MAAVKKKRAGAGAEDGKPRPVHISAKIPFRVWLELRGLASKRRVPMRDLTAEAVQRYVRSEA